MPRWGRRGRRSCVSVPSGARRRSPRGPRGFWDRRRRAGASPPEVPPGVLEAKGAREELTQVAQREGRDAGIERLLARLLAAATQSTQPEVAGQVREMAHRWSVPGLVGALRTLRDRPDSTDTLRGVRAPTLVLVGSEDQIPPPDTARAIALLIPGPQCHGVLPPG